MRTITVAAVAVGIVAACAPVAPPLSLTLPGPNGGDIVVTVQDGGRYVTAIRPAIPDRLPLIVDISNPDGNQRVLRVAWTAGSCRQAATIALVRSAGRINLRFDERPNCLEQIGVPTAVDLLLALPIPADGVDVTDDRRMGSD